MVDERVRLIDWGTYYDAMGKVFLPFKDLAQQGDVKIAIFKGGQPGTLAHLAAARAEGMKGGTYYWNDPLSSAAWQIDNISRLIEQEKPEFWALDIEQWWADWNKYWDWIYGKIPVAAVPVKDPFRISENARVVMEGLVQRFPATQLRGLPYTSAGFVNEHAPQMAAWLPAYNGESWVAAWPDYGKKPYKLTWQQIKDYPPADWQPTLLPGQSRWRLWQYSSRIIMPGAWYTLDWGLFNGSMNDFNAWLGGKAAPGVDPDLAALQLQVAALEGRVAALEARL